MFLKNYTQHMEKAPPSPLGLASSQETTSILSDPFFPVPLVDGNFSYSPAYSLMCLTSHLFIYFCDSLFSSGSKLYGFLGENIQSQLLGNGKQTTAGKWMLCLLCKPQHIHYAVSRLYCCMMGQGRSSPAALLFK